MRIIFLTYIFLLCSCITKHPEKKPDNESGNSHISDSAIENEIINQTVNAVLDSVDAHIMLNLDHDTSLYSAVYYYDTLLSQRYTYKYIQSISILDGITFDTLSKDDNLKLDLKLLKSNKDKEFKKISSIREIKEMATRNKNHFVLLCFTRVGLNKENDIGFFDVDLSCSYNAGISYLVLVQKKNNEWTIKRIIESGIR
jgi:hypothetical protein